MWNILVVDDERKALKFMVQKLKENSDWLVHSAKSAKDAINKIHANSYQVIVTDLIMEENTSGITVFEVAKQKDHDVEIIVITAYPDIKQALEATRKGVFGLISKLTRDPYNKMKKMVSKALSKRSGPIFDVFLSYNSKDSGIV